MIIGGGCWKDPVSFQSKAIPKQKVIFPQSEKKYKHSIRDIVLLQCKGVRIYLASNLMDAPYKGIVDTF